MWAEGSQEVVQVAGLAEQHQDHPGPKGEEVTPASLQHREPRGTRSGREPRRAHPTSHSGIPTWSSQTGSQRYLS